MSLRTKIIGATSATVLLAVPALALAALQPYRDGSAQQRAAALAVVEGAQPVSADAAGSTEVVNLADWQYTGRPSNPGNRPQSPHEQGRGHDNGRGHENGQGEGHDKHH